MAAIDNNLKAFKLLFEIETALREVLIMRCERDIGINWFESVFPPDVLIKSKTLGDQTGKHGLRGPNETRAKDDKKCWLGRLVVHPIYFVDFPQLSIALEKNSNSSFDAYFVSRNRKHICEYMTRLASIRNAVAHNRMIAETDLQTVQQAHANIRVEIGLEDFDTLVSNPPSQTATQSEMSELVAELKEAARAIDSANSFRLKRWPALKHRWWLKPEWQLDAGSVCAAFELIEAYSLVWQDNYMTQRRKAQDWKTFHWTPSIMERALASLRRDEGLQERMTSGEDRNQSV